MKDNYLWTPLMCACHRGDIAIVDLLLNIGANINVTDTARNTPVSIAKQCNHQEVYDLLVKRLNGDVKRNIISKISITY
ncbi:ankyrin repeat and EF-hand domain-containing protein 1-like [Diaphorina citri]|uniref:Ankyrin repeat and EF-hand domain-containing protein 1-like n=1 Tax=Diaphorina citri TaxID=121845 RepID=A0A3Q0JNE0_DIACI|nr:ankyrin repeat and EF-hand domain-containing protein 1-like [Diaphorina citri]